MACTRGAASHARSGAQNAVPGLAGNPLPRPVPRPCFWPQWSSQAPEGQAGVTSPPRPLQPATDPAPLPIAFRDFQRLINNLGGGETGLACCETFQAKLPPLEQREHAR